MGNDQSLDKTPTKAADHLRSNLSVFGRDRTNMPTSDSDNF